MIQEKTQFDIGYYSVLFNEESEQIDEIISLN